MKMSTLEKRFVNSPSHSQQVSHYAEKLLKLTNFKAGQKFLDVGCGNGAAAIYVAKKYGLHVTGLDVDPQQIRLAQEQSQHISNLRFLSLKDFRYFCRGEKIKILKEVGIVGNRAVRFRRNLFSNVGIYLLEK